MIQRSVATKSTGKRARPTDLKRAEQLRAQETRSAILEAALAEFVAKGYAGTSIRSISDRIGLRHPLISYHYRSKEILWQAVAEHVFERIRQAWDGHLAETSPTCAAERVRLVYRALFRVTIDFPEFHHFIHQEVIAYSPRLQWITDNFINPLINWLLPQIQSAQDEGGLPKAEPILLHYLLVGLTSTLSGFGPEMQATANISSSDPAVVEAYWNLVEDVVFNKKTLFQEPSKTLSRPNRTANKLRGTSR